MTHVAGGRRRRTPRGWLLPLIALVLILVAASGGILSRVILLDLVAWWPIWVLLALVGFFARDARLGRVRVAGLVPLLAIVCLAVFVYGYFAAWPVMPSAALELIGPEATTARTAALSARIGGDLEIETSEDGFLYEARPLRRGGSIGPPDAVERSQGKSFSVALRPAPDPGLYTFNGWSLQLSESTTWSLTLEGDAVSGDLSALEISEMHLIGEGELIVGPADGPTTVTVEGNFQLEVPGDAPIEVIGDATVPDDWEATTDGWISPAGGEGWLFSTGEGATLVITNH